MTALRALRPAPAPEGLSSILDRLARCEITKTQAEALLAEHDMPDQAVIECENCGDTFNDTGDGYTLCRSCDAEQQAESAADARRDDE